MIYKLATVEFTVFLNLTVPYSEYSKHPRIRTYRLKLGILVPKYIRTYLGWQRTIGSYAKNTYFVAKMYWILIDRNCEISEKHHENYLFN